MLDSFIVKSVTLSTMASTMNESIETRLFINGEVTMQAAIHIQ